MTPCAVLPWRPSHGSPRPAELPSSQVCAADAVLCKAVSTRRLQVVPSGSGLPVIDLSKARGAAAAPACWAPPAVRHVAVSLGCACAEVAGRAWQAPRATTPALRRPSLRARRCKGTALHFCTSMHVQSWVEAAAASKAAPPPSPTPLLPPAVSCCLPLGPTLCCAAVLQVSPELAEAAAGADLVVLEGMGRSIETNLHVKLRWAGPAASLG